MISTQVQLATGETVKCYYIDEQTKKNIETLLASSSQLVTERQLNYQREQFEQLTTEIRKTIYHPIIQKKIADLLKNQDLTAKAIRNKIMPDSRTQLQEWRSFWEVWGSWVKAEIIVRIPQAKYKPGLWHLLIKPSEASQ
jgi:hypothetical protein